MELRKYIITATINNFICIRINLIFQTVKQTVMQNLSYETFLLHTAVKLSPLFNSMRNSVHSTGINKIGSTYADRVYLFVCIVCRICDFLSKQFFCVIEMQCVICGV